MTSRYVSSSLLALALCSEALVQAASLPVPNSSFESPTVPAGFPAFPVIDVWQKNPEPAGIPLPGGITWDQLAGVFPNTPAGAADHIDNVDGNQAAYLLSIPGVGLSQELSQTFQPGNGYTFTVGILGGGGIPEGSSFVMSMYYRDAANQQVPLATQPVVYSAATFPNATHLNDYSVSVPVVQDGDAWAGQSIGLSVGAAFGTGVGYWDIDNVRLTSVPEPGTVSLLVFGLGVLGGRRLLASRAK